MTPSQALWTTQAVYKADALLVCAAAFYLFYYLILKKRSLVSSACEGSFFLSLVIVCGTLVRLMIAREGYGNYDNRSWEIAGEIALRGGNIYQESQRYTSSPIWFWLIGLLKKAQTFFPALGLGFFVRAFLTGIDLLTLGVLLALADRQRISRAATAVFFYLNPVSFLLTGYHGQFENLALFFLLVGLWGYFYFEKRTVLKTAWLWVFSSAGLITKHIIFYETLAALRFSVKKTWVQAVLFLLSCAAFFAVFLPYWKEGGEAIIRNVFLYSSYPMDYGISTFFRTTWLKYLFIAGLFVYPLLLTSKDLVKRLLLCALFFLVFTTGFGNQYLVLPIALGALRPSKGFLIYTFAATLYLLGDQTNIYVRAFSWVPLNLVWVAAVHWWATEHWTTKDGFRVAA